MWPESCCIVPAYFRYKRMWDKLFVGRCFLLLGINKLGVKKFQVKIGLNNEISIAMFKKLHFREVGPSHVYDRDRCVPDAKPEIHPIPCATGVCVSGVQGSDPGADGGRVCQHEAAGRSVCYAGERLQTGLRQQQTAAELTAEPHGRALKTSGILLQ